MGIGTKPSRAGTRISRPALTRRLADSIDSGAVILVAAAGSGKTMALEEALAARGGDVAWVKCRPAHADAGRLLDHLVDVLRTAAPGTADVLGDTLAAAVAPVDVETSAQELVEEIERLVVDPLTIVFDDAEHLAESEGATGIVRSLLASRAEPLRVAVASRRPLPLRLAKPRAEGRLVELGAADLAFSASECEKLLRLRRGAGVTEAEVEAAMEATEGWPLGLALGARQGGGPAAAPGSLDELSEYLVEEVLAGLEPGFRRQLLASSLAPELTEGVVGALGLDAGFREEVVRRDLFLRQLGDGDRFAYHPLFREVLLERLRIELSEDERRQLHAALAAALSEERPLDAVEHWLAADRETEAVRIIGRNSQPLVRSSPEVVQGWIERVSPEARSEPAIQLLRGQLAMGVGRHGEIVEILAEAAAEWERRGSRATWTARFALAQALIVLGRFDEVPPLAEGFDSPDTDNVVAAPMVAMWAAIAIGGVGRRDEGRELLDRARGHPLGGLLDAMDYAFDAYLFEWHAGQLDAANDKAEMAISRMEEFDPVRWLPFTLWYASYVHEARGEHELAVRRLERSQEVTRGYGIGEYPAAVAGAIKAGLDARAGRLAEAELELARVEPQLTGSWHGYEAELARVEVAAARGDRPEALAAASRAQSLVEGGYLGERLRAATLLAPLLERLGEPAAARATVDGALEARTPGTRAPRLLALRAWLREGEGDPAALEDLGEAWAEAGDQARYLVRGEWPRIERLLQDGIEAGVLDAAEVVEATREALPGGDALISFLDHPTPAARSAAAAAVATSGNPAAPARLEALAADPDETVADAARRASERLRHDPPALAFSLFGGFEVRRGGRIVEEAAWERRAAERLVRFLLIQGEEAVPEDVLFEAFWEGRDPASARRSLQVAVSCARAVLDPPETDESALDARERSYRLALRNGDSVDTRRFEHAARAALADGGGDPETLRHAVSLWGGEPLPEERYEQWSAAWREGLVDTYSELLTALAEACLAKNDAFGATAAARRLVELDPLSEAAHRLLMVSFARSGRRGHALRQFLDCRRALVDELGLEPAAQTAEIHRAILAGERV